MSGLGGVSVRNDVCGSWRLAGDGAVVASPAHFLQQETKASLGVLHRERLFENISLPIAKERHKGVFGKIQSHA